MADITDPIVVRFSNERARVAADALEQAYNTAKRLTEEYEALEDEASLPDTDEQIADGSEDSRGDEADGRTPVTGSDLRALLALSQRLVDWFSYVPAEDGRSRIDTVRHVSVNGQAPF